MMITIRGKKCCDIFSKRSFCQQVARNQRKQSKEENLAKVQKRHAKFIEGKTGMWEIVVGLEVHAQVVSSTKLFAATPSTNDQAANSRVGLVDAAFPGTLPVLNMYCVDQALKTGAAIGGTLNRVSRFDRKHYFYHDLPMGYQITQYYHPIVSGGNITLELEDGSTKNIGIERIQLETDSGKSIHDAHPLLTYIDFNRAGIPLMEIITHPEISSAHEASLFLNKLIHLLRHIDTCQGDMGDGTLRCDANVSVRRVDSDTEEMTNKVKVLGERCEIKNLNSIRALVNAIDYEAKRQIALIEGGGQVEMETRWFDPVKRLTYTARKKEDKIDYRYFPEPDLPALIISQDRINDAISNLPPLPDQIKASVMETYNLSSHAAQLIIMQNGGIEYIKEAVEYSNKKKYQLETYLIAQSLINDVFSYLPGGGNSDDIETFHELNSSQFPLPPSDLVDIVNMTNQKKLLGMTKILHQQQQQHHHHYQ
eukprot:TRINITY_DN3822_c0_g1_i5.p1 TRINITY_DN3822_c0_g1~~TRINITY_DN3822_c0_g1_i5.p1  ORF type:complete len:480 (+),score=119.32 TRINITY_DN3822_c0_g1_i5:28-1467(+)